MQARLTLRAHEVVLGAIRSGDFVVDATVGNGHDTVFLAHAVGPSGRVYGFDVQQAALDATRGRLEEAGVSELVTLLCAGHEDMSARLPGDLAGRVGAVMFNLGYLPGSDRAVVTQPDTTAVALDDATALIRPGGIVSVLVYTGHPGGEAELEAVRCQCERWTGSGFAVEFETRDAPRSPILFTASRS